MAIKLGGESTSQINEVISLNNDADTVTLADGRVYLKGGVFENNLATYPLAFSGLKAVLNFSTATQITAPGGVTWDGTHYWAVGFSTDAAYKYDSSGKYTGTSFDVSVVDTLQRSILWDGTFFWVLGGTNNRLYKFNAGGSYQSVEFSVNAQSTSPQGATWDGTFFWVIDTTGDVYKYNASGVYQSVSWSTAGEMSNPTGIAWDGTAYFWVSDYDTQSLYKYNSSFVYQNESIFVGEVLVDVGSKDSGPMAFKQSSRSISVYEIVNGILSSGSFGAQNYVRVV